MGPINFNIYKDFLWGERGWGGGSEAALQLRRQRGQRPLWPLSPSCTRGRPACCSAGFLRREIKRSPQIERVTFWGERERVLLSEQEWPSFCGERASGVERIRHRRDNNMRLRCEKKATLGGNQRRRILQACISSMNLSVTDFIAHYQYGSNQ
jgi:hypothetical protein